MDRVSNLEDHIGYWLRIISNHVHTAFAAKLSESGVTVAEWVILRHIFGNHNVSQTALVKTTGLTKGAVSKLVDRLCNKNLVVSSVSRRDSRAHNLRLSKVGNRIVPQVARLADANDDEFFKCFSREEKRLVIDLMRRVVERNRLRLSGAIS